MTIAISTLDAKFDQNDLGQISARNLLRIARLHGKIVGGEQIVIPGSGPSGFDIVLRLSEGAAIGDFGGLVQDFYGLDEALNWAERCFVESYRLRIEHIGGWPRRWTL